MSPERWQDIWLNEGWATYAEWLWIEESGGPTAQDQFEDVMAIPADDEFWGAVIADPGPHGLFGAAVYYRGAAALYALRLEIGDKAFSAGTRSWLHRYNDSTATTEDFEAVYEKASGHDLGAFFDSGCGRRRGPQRRRHSRPGPGPSTRSAPSAHTAYRLRHPRKPRRDAPLPCA